MNPSSITLPPAASLPALMSEVLRQAGLRVPAPIDDAYTLYFDDEPSLHVLANGDGAVDVLAEAGRLGPAANPNVLLELLALNGLNRREHPVAISIDRASGTVLVWGRQRLAVLDVAGMRCLVQCVRQQSAEVRRLLGQQETSSRSGDAGKWKRLLRPQR